MPGDVHSLLVLLLADDAEQPLRAAIEARIEPPERVLVVAPALVGDLDWLFSAEDEAQRQAEVRALSSEWSLADSTQVAASPGDVDPVQAVADALHEFAADEILVVGPVDRELDSALSRFGLPVGHIATGEGRGQSFLRRLAGGRDDATPFVVFVGANLALLLASALLSLVVLLILWLIGTV